MAFSDAVVLPLGLGTAASGLYGKKQLALAPPSQSPVRTGEVVLIWGGSSSVGCSAIQLAVASGYTCVTTASAQNADMLKSLGASEVFDHTSSSVVEDVIHALRGRRLAGTLHATGDMAACLAVVRQCDGSRSVAVTLAPSADLTQGVEAQHIHGTSLKDDEVGPMIYSDFLPQALQDRRFVPAPPPRIVGDGLEALQDALQVLKAGVSGAKVVVTLS
jgi:NADPH:quinone reductase-like Zn-dependent oxidoreductase